MVRRTRGAFDNVVWLIGGFLKEVAEVGDDFVTCFKGLAGEDPKEDATTDAKATGTQTTSLSDFFSSLNTVIEFLCYVKDTLLDYFSKETKRLMRLKKLNRKMYFLEKKRGRRVMSEAMRKKLWGDLVSWVKSAAGKVADAAKAAASKVTGFITTAWETIKAKFKEFKAWVIATWEKVKAWTVKAAKWIESFNTLKSCVASGKAISTQIKDGLKKVVDWFKNIASRATAIAAAIAGSPKDIATVLVGIICAIPHVVKIIEIYKDTTISNEWYRWGKIVARAGYAFTA